MKLFASAAVGALLFAGQAMAATLSIVGGDDDIIKVGGHGDKAFNPAPAVADAAPGDDVLRFHKGNIAGAGLNLDGNGQLLFTFLGKEAAAKNTAVELVGGTSLSNTGAVGASIRAAFSDGLVDFLFSTLTEGGAEMASITNGVGVDGLPAEIRDSLSISFKQISDTKVLAFFGDGRGDLDFDDMIIEISAVPLPAGMLLLLTGLGGLGVASRRRKAA